MFHIKRRSWGKETPLSDEIRDTPPPLVPPQRYCDCLLRYEDYTNIWGERACKQCRKPRPPIGVFKTPDTQQAKERMTMSTEYHANGFPTMTADDVEIKRLQSLLTTPNLSQANIDEINAQLQALLVKKRGEQTKTGEVWMDGK